MSSEAPPKHVIFDPTPEIFATDNGGSFWFPLTVNGESHITTREYDEARIVISLWHPSSQRTIDLDRAYVESRGSFDRQDKHWFKLAEIEPVVPPYDAGESFDGWIVLPIFSAQTALALAGSGFHPRARLQIRASAYFVS